MTDLIERYHKLAAKWEKECERDDADMNDAEFERHMNLMEGVYKACTRRQWTRTTPAGGAFHGMNGPVWRVRRKVRWMRMWRISHHDV